jgi:cellulose biosynthesis protein BcsQ
VAELPWPILKTRLVHRQAYRQASATARTVIELARYSDASLDLASVVKEILEILIVNQEAAE